MAASKKNSRRFVKRSRTVEDQNMLLETFWATARNAPHRRFLLAEGRKAITYGEAADAVRRIVARQVTTVGRVVLVASNTDHFVLVLLASIATAREVYVVSDHDLAEPALFPVLQGDHQLLQPRDMYTAVAGTLSEDGGLRSEDIPEPLGECTVAFFSSGSTGQKKLICFRAQTLARRALSWAGNFGLGGEDIFFCTSTLAHSHGLNIHLVPALVLGAGLSLTDLRTMTVWRLAKQFALVSPTVFTALPVLYRALVVHSVDLDFGSVRLAIAGSEPLDSELHAELRARYFLDVLDQFGCAESGPVCLVEHRMGQRYVGRILDGKSLRIGELGVGGVRTLRAESDVMADEIITHERRISKPPHVELGDMTCETPQGLRLLSRGDVLLNAQGRPLSCDEVESSIASAVQLQACAIFLGKDGTADVLYEGEDAQAPRIREHAVVSLGIDLNAVLRVNRVPLSSSGKRIRNLGALSGTMLLSDVGRQGCEKWLRRHFELVKQYDGADRHEVAARADNPAAFNSLTSAELTFHNDAYDYANVPRFLALYCVQPSATGGATHVSDASVALATLPEETGRFLREAEFDFFTEPARFHGYPPQGVRAPVLGQHTVRFSAGYLRRAAPEVAQPHIERFSEALQEHRETYALKAGELLLVNNRRMLHARSAFTGHRLLYRFWLS